MNWPNVISTEWTLALGYTLVHTLWIGAIIGLLTFLVLRILRSKPPRIKYLVATSGLMAMMLAFVAVLVLQWPSAPEAATSMTTCQFAASETPTRAVPAESSQPTIWEKAHHLTKQHFPYLVSAWLLGVLFFMLKTLAGWIYIKQLKTRHTYDVPLHIQRHFKKWKTEIGMLRKVRLVESNLATVPMTIGHFRPFIILPAGTLATLTLGQLKMVILHELAHIHRHDYLINLFQSLAEALLFYHPVAWWLSSEMRKERENCCDDLAIAWGGSSHELAQALAAISSPTIQTPALAVGFAGKKFHLLHRIERLLSHREISSHSPLKFMLMIAIIIFAIVFSSAAVEKTEDHQQVGISASSSVTAFVTPDWQRPVSIKIPAAKIDTPKGEIKVVRKFDEGPHDKVMLKMEDGKVQKLKIDGKRISEENYEQYEDLIAEMVPNYGKDNRDDRRKHRPGSMAPPHPPRPPMPPKPHMGRIPELPPLPSFHKQRGMNGADTLIIKYDSAGTQKQIIIDLPSFDFDDEKWREIQDSLRESRQEMMEEYREEMEEYREEMREMRENMQELHEKRRSEMREERRSEREKIQKRQEERVLKFGKKLQEMGLIEDWRTYSLSLSGDELKVNGEVQNEEVYEEFKQWYEEEFDREITDRVNINISIN